MPSSTHKKRRLKKSSRRSIPTIDRISDIPDSILCHILYFLPTKLAATTSVLSKRWKRLWLSVLAIKFDSRDFKTSDLFIRVLYSTMYRRETTLPIYSFVFKSLANSSFVTQKDVNQFVYHVLQRGIQNFNLDLSKKSREIIELPSTILSCRTLKFLKLRNLTVGDISQVDLYLPSLKTLYLHKVEFGCHEHLMKLLSSCPILENLEITIINSLKNRFLVDYIALPSLKSLHLNKVEFGCHENLMKLLSSCPILEKLEITKSCFIQKDVNQFVSLVLQRGIQNLCLNLSKICLYTIELPVTILSCRTLKVLKLKNLKVGDISQVDLFLPNLKTLHLHKIDFECHEHLIKLLLSCPILEDLDTKRIFVMDFASHFSVDFTAFPNLIKAWISEFYIPLSMVCKAETLRVESVFMLTCCTQLPMFESLTHLELSLHSEVGNPKWEWLLGMLKLSPKLQNLIIQDNKDLKETSDEWLEDPPLIPKCLSSQLKTCRIRVFKGTKYDLEFAKYIMENSKVLETMTINSICLLDINAKDQLLMKLSSCKRGSTTCKLLFD